MMIINKDGTVSLVLTEDMEVINLADYPSADPNEADKDNRLHWYD